MMLLSLTISCPACGAKIDSAAGACPHCIRTTRRAWSTPALRPLVLPGNSGLSADVPETARRDFKLVGATIACAVVLSTSLVAARVADDRRDQRTPLATQIAAMAPQESGTVAWVTVSALPAPTPAASRKAGAPTLVRMQRTPQRQASPAARATPSASDIAQQVELSRMAEQVSVKPPVAREPLTVRTRADSALIGPASALTTSAAASTPALAASPLAAPSVARPTLFAASPSRLDDDDVRTAVTRFVSVLASRSGINGDLMAFYDSGKQHRVAIMAEPAMLGGAPSSVRVAFDIKLSKYDSFGRQQSRVLPVSMIVAKRDGDVSASAVTFGELRRQ